MILKRTLMGLGILILLLLIGLPFGFFLLQDHLIFHPTKIAQEFVFEFDQEFEELNFSVKDGKVNALWFKAKQSKGLIFYCHGNATTVNQVGRRAEEYLQLGYDLLVFDYRSYGKSIGRLSEENLNADIKILFDWARKEYDEGDIVVYGRSLGCTFACRLAAENSPQALILESPFYNLEDMSKRFYPFLPFKKLSKYQFESNRWLKEVVCPTWIFHGDQDRVVPLASGIKLKPLLKDPTKFIILKGFGHNNINQSEIFHKSLKSALH